MSDCIFCKIASHEIPKKPEEVKFEDDNFIAFLDIHPKAPGHTVLIPKAHYKWFIDTPDEVSDGLFRVAKIVAKELKTEYNSDYIHLSIVGKDVPHAHVHLIPRKLVDAGPGI